MRNRTIDNELLVTKPYQSNKIRILSTWERKRRGNFSKVRPVELCQWYAGIQVTVESSSNLFSSLKSSSFLVTSLEAGESHTTDVPSLTNFWLNPAGSVFIFHNSKIDTSFSFAFISSMRFTFGKRRHLYVCECLHVYLHCTGNDVWCYS